MYEPITVEVDRGYGPGAYRSHTITFTGRKVWIIQKGCTTMRLYEWVDQGHLVYLVHVEEDKPGQILRRTLYPFINTHLARATPTKGYTAEDVYRAYPEFSDGEFFGRPRSTTTK